MSPFDVVLIVLAVLSAFGGYRRGAILQAFGLVGLAFGAAVAVPLAPALSGFGGDDLSQVAIALGVVVVGAALGNLAGWLLGGRVRSKVEAPIAARTDAVIGAIVSVAALFLATWFLAVNLAAGPFPSLARELRTSRVVAVLDEWLPRPPALLPQLERAAGALGLPDVFAGLPRTPAAPVDLPDDPVVAAAARAAGDRVMVVLAEGCTVGFFNEGTGFIASPEHVVTNAHVVAGTDRHQVQRGHELWDAQVVLFDPGLDLAVLYVPGLIGDPMTFTTSEQPRGQGGAVVGFPGGRLDVAPAAVRATIDALGRDIYGEQPVTRRLIELGSKVRPGHSGSPFVLADGTVAGVVFASSTTENRVAYALVATQVTPLVHDARDRTQPTSTGRCTPSDQTSS